MKRENRHEPKSPALRPPPLRDPPARDVYLENLRESYRLRRSRRVRERHRAILLIVGIILLLALACIADRVFAGEPARAPTRADVVATDPAYVPTDEQVDAALKWWVRDAPRNPLRVASYRLEVARALVDQSIPRGIPVELAAAMVLRESSGAQTAVGARGEIGLMQVHPGTAALFRCQLNTPDEQIECGCRVLAHHMARCSTLRGALAAYGSNASRCRPKPKSRLARMVDNRFRLAAELRAVMDGGLK